MIPNVEQNRAAIADLCRRFGIRKLELFGSACTDEFDPTRSDLDFLVEFPPDYDFGPWLSRLSQFQQALAQLFGRRVDVIMRSALRNPWFRLEADKARVTLYHAPEESEVATGHR